MMPLGHINSYQDFGRSFRRLVNERNREGCAFGFLFDDLHLTIANSRLTQDMRAIRTLNDELGDHITVFYLHDSSVRLSQLKSRTQYRQQIDEFNRALISTLGVPSETIRLPCLTLFQIHGDTCSHVRQVPLESRSSLFLVTDMVQGIRTYKEWTSNAPSSLPSSVGGSWPAVRASLTLVDLVNTVTDFAERATQAVQTFLI
jgi:hypothetical protein